MEFGRLPALFVFSYLIFYMAMGDIIGCHGIIIAYY
jgi:hypothetical protein